LTKKQGLTSGARHWVTNWDMVWKWRWDWRGLL
jgi:hypothetical protein